MKRAARAAAAALSLAAGGACAAFAGGSRARVLDFTSPEVISAIRDGIDTEPWVVPEEDGRQSLELRLPPTDDGWTQFDLSVGEEFLNPDWTGWAAAQFELVNLDTAPVLVGVRWRNVPGSDGDGMMAQYTAELQPKAHAVWRLPLLALEYGQAVGDLPDQPGLRSIELDGHADLSRVVELGLFFDTRRARRLRLYRLDAAEPISATGWVDAHGQYRYGSWPEKVSSDADLIARDRAEQAALSSATAPGGRDEYGAWLDGPRLSSAPFFRLARDAHGRTWLAAPGGRPYFADCLGGVTPDAAGRWDDARRKAYSWVPPKRGAFASVWLDASSQGSGAAEYWPSFYRANLIRKWGADSDVDALFGERAAARLSAWGFTCLGPWSQRSLLPSKLPYFSDGPSMELDVPAIYPPGEKTGSGRLPDVYDPSFAPQVEQAASALAKTKDDPYLIAHFFDEEPAWDRFQDGILGLSNDAPARRRFLQFLKTRYGSAKRLDAAWGLSVSSLKDVRDPGSTEQARRDWDELVARAAARYCETLSRAVRRADPNHLLFGSRFAVPGGEATRAAARACAPFVDAEAVDEFTFQPAGLTPGKPYFVAAYSFNSLDAGLLTAAGAVSSQAQRGAAYRRFLQACAADAGCVGASFYQYVDEPITGRGDGDTSLNGFVTVADVPYAPLVQAARAANSRIYRMRGESTGRRRPR